VVPTYKTRHHFHRLVNHTFFTQEYPESKLDLLVYDDNSMEESPLASYWKGHPRVTYMHDSWQTSIGWKRNWLMDHANGEVIVNFDDDDFYNKHYVRYMVEYLMNHNSSGVKLAKMGGWFHVVPRVFNAELYTGEGSFEAGCFQFPNEGWAFSWAYFQDVASECRFPSVFMHEELQFLDCLQRVYGNSSVHQIGDVFSQLLKIDVCNGLTTPPSTGYQSSVETNTLKSLYGLESWRAMFEFGPARVNLSQCRGNHGTTADKRVRGAATFGCGLHVLTLLLLSTNAWFSMTVHV